MSRTDMLLDAICSWSASENIYKLNWLIVKMAIRVFNRLDEENFKLLCEDLKQKGL